MILRTLHNIVHNSTIRNGAYFTLFSSVNKGANFILLILLAKYITPHEYGYWSLFGTIVMLLGYFIAMTTQGYLSVSYFREGMIGVRKTFSCILFTSLITVILMILFTLLLRPLIFQSLGFPWRYLYLAIGISFFTLYTNVCLDMFRIQKNIRNYGIFSCGSAILILLLSIFFVKFMFMGWTGCVLAQIICVCLFGTIGLGIIFRMGGFALPDISHWKIMLCWGLPLIPHLATQFIRLGCDRYIINHYYSIEMVGLFSFAYTLAMAISTIGNGFNEANSVNIYETLGNKNLRSEEKKIFLNKQKKYMLLIYLCGLIVIVLLSVLFVPIFLPKYTSAIAYFFFLSFFAFCQCLYFLYTNFLFFFKQTQSLMTITFSFAVIHLIISLLFTQYSLYCTCAAYCITQLGVVFFVRKKSNQLLEDYFNL